MVPSFFNPNFFLISEEILFLYFGYLYIVLIIIIINQNSFLYILNINYL